MAAALTLEWQNPQEPRAEEKRRVLADLGLRLAAGDGEGEAEGSAGTLTLDLADPRAALHRLVEAEQALRARARGAAVALVDVSSSCRPSLLILASWGPLPPGVGVQACRRPPTLGQAYPH